MVTTWQRLDLLMKVVYMVGQHGRGAGEGVCRGAWGEGGRRRGGGRSDLHLVLL